LSVGAVPELRQLRVFVAVAEERNFTRAAERLHLAQQAVSKSVRQLERELGVELLERTTREVRLTPAGAALLAAGRETLAAADTAFARAREVGAALAGRVRIGATPAVGASVLGEVVEVLREGAPELSVAALELRPSEISRSLRDRGVDLVLARTWGGGPEVESAALRPTPAILVVPADHRLAEMQAVDLAELDGERLLTWSPPGTPYTDLLIARLAAANARVEPVESRVTGAPAFTELAAQRAVALVPSGWPPADGLVQLPIRDDVTLPLLVLWATGPPPAAVQRIRAGMMTGAQQA
jgi:DNA-binding transcriptional LysR family regulator